MARRAEVIISHWSYFFEGMQPSSQEFYASLEKVIELQELPKTKTSRIFYREGGVFSADREYLRIKRHEHTFDVCAAPFAKGFFVSWWLGESLGIFWQLMLMIPYFGAILMGLFRPMTYFRLDTASMFQGAVHSGVMEIVDGLTKANGLRALSEMERKPTMTDFFGSKSSK